MNDSSQTLNDLVRAFVSAADSDAVNAFEALYRRGIEPIAASIIRYKLRVTLRNDDDRHINQLGLDLMSEVKASLLPKFWRMRTDGEGVDNADAYVRSGALNTYRLYLRQKYPNRLRLRNKLRLSTCRGSCL